MPIPRIGIVYIEPGSPWENPFIESFNGKLRDELLNVEAFETLDAIESGDVDDGYAARQ